MQTIDMPMSTFPVAETLDDQYLAGYFAAGIAVITTLDLGRPLGFAVNSLSTLSFTPPTISFCVANQMVNRALIEGMDTFCINLLSDKQKEICDIFARRGGTRFQTSERLQTRSGLPILAGILSWVECKTINIVPASDHTIILGHAVDMATVERGRPLVFYQGRFGTFKTS